MIGLSPTEFVPCPAHSEKPGVRAQPGLFFVGEKSRFLPLALPAFLSESASSTMIYIISGFDPAIITVVTTCTRLSVRFSSPDSIQKNSKNPSKAFPVSSDRQDPFLRLSIKKTSAADRDFSMPHVHLWMSFHFFYTLKRKCSTSPSCTS